MIGLRRRGFSILDVKRTESLIGLELQGKYHIFTSLLVLVVAFVIGCASSRSQRTAVPAVLTPNGTDSEIEERILELAPVGTSIDKAKQSLSDAGLRCSVEVDATNGERYVSCGHSDDRDIWVTWVWDIRVLCIDGFVTGVVCKQAGTGL